VSETVVDTPEQPRGQVPRAWLVVPLLVFAWVTLVVATAAHYDQLANPGADIGPIKYFDLFFSDTIHMKAWFASAAGVLALFQIFSAAWIFGRLPFERPRWLAFAHRWSGRLAFAISLPVAYHCIFLLGFQDATTRTLAHSLMGCFFYGAIAAKVLIVRTRRLPGWVLPVAGGIVFACLIGVWYTSSLWFFREVDIGR
jgi:hypothetical protein